MKSKVELLEEIKQLEIEISNLRTEKDGHDSILVEEHEQHMSFTNNLPVGVFKSTMDGKFIYANKKMKNILGFSSLEELKNYPIDDLYEDKTKRVELINMLRDGRDLQCNEVQLRRKDKSILWGTLSEKLVSDKKGNFINIEGILLEITDKKENEKEIKKLGTLVEQAAISIALTDLEGNIEYVNPFFEELTGYNLEELKGINPRILKSPNAEYPESYYKEMWEIINSGNVWKGQFTNRKKNGEDYIEEATIFPVKTKNGELLCFGAVKKDITSQVKLERELESSLKEMESLKEKAESASRFKSSFLANMSHDIRTPLNAIIGFSDLLNKFTLNEKQTGYVENIKRSGDILLNLINDILDLSKIEAGHLNILNETFFIDDLVNNISSIFDLQFEKKNINFKIKIKGEIPEKVYSDKSRIQQILVNFLSNSLKYTLRGEVTMEISFNKISDKILFDVVDTGIGIPDNIQEKIFTPFFINKDLLNIQESSAGLGLSICKNLSDLLGGNITMKSKFGCCSKFSIELPVNSDKVENIIVVKDKVSFSEDNVRDLYERKILIAEDNPTNAELLNEALVINGFQNIKVAKDGIETINTALKFNPHLIIADNKMPNKSGIEALKELREKGFENPIIILSADVDEDMTIRGLMAGADSYLTKPINFENLFSEIFRLLKIKNMKGVRKTVLNENVDDPGASEFKIKKNISEKLKQILIRDLKEKEKRIKEILDEDKIRNSRNEIALIAHTYKGNTRHFDLKSLETGSLKLDQAFKNNLSDRKIKDLTINMANIIENILKNN